MNQAERATWLAIVMMLTAGFAFFLIDDWLPSVSFLTNTLSGNISFLKMRIPYFWIVGVATLTAAWAVYTILTRKDD